MMNKINSFLLSGILFGAIVSCATKNPVYDSFSGFVQGTTYSIIFQNDGKLTPLTVKTGVEDLLHEFDMSLSIYQDSSIVSKINRNEDVEIDSFFTEVFRKAEEITKLTNGCFDVTVGPLVKAWGFGPDAMKNFSELKRDSLMKLVGMDKVKISGDRLVKADPDIILDFNAIAKGFSVDVVGRYLDRLGVESYLVEIGGEIRVKGDKGGVMWRIGIDKPADYNFSPGGKLQAVISLKERSLATSGNYRKFFVENGVKYSHTIDPATGYPVKHTLLSATILAGDCATADAVATACMVMGLDKSISFLNEQPEFEGYLIYSDDTGEFRTWSSEGLDRLISESEEN